MVTLVDHQGNPIQKDVLKEPQTSRVGWLHQEFENHPSRGLTPSRLARIMEDAERGDLVAQAELFADMEEKDAHIYSEMSKRKRALLTLDWQIVPPENPSKEEQDEAEWLRQKLREIPDFEDLLLDALDGIGYGYACLELEWELLGKEWVVKSATHRPQSWFQLARLDRNELRLRDMSMDGQPLQPYGWLVHRHRAKSGFLGRSGLHRILAWPFLFKNYSVRDLAEFLEIYGLPLRLGTYPVGANDQEKATLLRAVTSIGHNAGGIIPEGMKLDFQEAAKGASDPFMAMIDWAERSQSKAIVGQTTSSEAKATGLGSGVANLHGEVRQDLKESDARQLASTITRDLLWPYIALNRGARDPRRMCRFEFDTGEAEDLKLYSEALPKLAQMGMRIPRNWAHEKLRIPEAQEKEAVLEVAAPAVLDMPPAGTAATRMAALRNESTPETDELDALADQMGDDWQEVIAPLVNPLERLAEECNTLEEFRARLPMVLEQMDTAAMTELIAQGTFAALIWGRVGNK